MTHTVTVTGVPPWIDPARLLGPGVRADGPAYVAALPRDEAADVQARLRNVGLGGQVIHVHVTPHLKRSHVRAARTRDARARRDTTPGFTRSDVHLDEEGRWSLTPEVLALAMGAHAEGRHVIDLGCGVGGNAIGFARAGCTVDAIEADRTRAAMARHNAAVYDVSERITVHHADGLALLPTLRADLIFIDPPWGTEWNREQTTADDFPLLGAALADGREVWAKLPPSFDPRTVPGSIPAGAFGRACGDRHRVKFVWLRVPATSK